LYNFLNATSQVDCGSGPQLLLLPLVPYYQIGIYSESRVYTKMNCKVCVCSTCSDGNH